MQLELLLSPPLHHRHWSCYRKETRDRGMPIHRPRWALCMQQEMPFCVAHTLRVLLHMQCIRRCVFPLHTLQHVCDRMCVQLLEEPWVRHGGHGGIPARCQQGALGPLKSPQGSTAGYTSCRAGASHHLIQSLDSCLGCLVEPLASISSCSLYSHGSSSPLSITSHSPWDPAPLPSSILPLAHLIPPLSGDHPLHVPAMLRVAAVSFLSSRQRRVGGGPGRSHQPRSVLLQVLLTFSLPPNFSWT